jgi:hypothetical protein
MSSIRFQKKFFGQGANLFQANIQNDFQKKERDVYIFPEYRISMHKKCRVVWISMHPKILVFARMTHACHERRPDRRRNDITTEICNTNSYVTLPEDEVSTRYC